MYEHIVMDHQTYLKTFKDFRLAMYGVFGYAKDAAFELIDALSSSEKINSVIELSLSPSFTRRHHSVARAIQDISYGRGKSKQTCNANLAKRITKTLCEHTPEYQKNEIVYGACDVTPNTTPYSKKLAEKQVVHQNTSTPGQKPIAIGHNLSCISLTTQDSNWALPVSLKRVPFNESQTLFGLKQAIEVSQHLNGKKFIVCADAKYSHIECLKKAMNEKNLTMITRVSKVRKFYQEPLKEDQMGNKKGAKRKYGQIFKLEQQNNATCFSAQKTFTHVHNGKNVTIEVSRFDQLMLRGKRKCPMHECRFSVFRIWVYKEDNTPMYQEPLWLVASGGTVAQLALDTVFNAYNLRFNIEHWFKFAKKHLLLDKYQSSEVYHHEHWLYFPMITSHMLYHARFLCGDVLRPWEAKSMKERSPAHVQRDMIKVLSQCESIVEPCKPRGIGTGQVKGNQNTMTRAESPILFKSQKNEKEQKIIIKFEVDNDGRVNKIRLNSQGAVQCDEATKESVKKWVENSLKSAA